MGKKSSLHEKHAIKGTVLCVYIKAETHFDSVSYSSVEVAAGILKK
jgi:hypothetical protein